MNAIAFCLDLVLASLLIAALYVGLKLDRKLKALKDSHVGFAGAVAELDAAVITAQDALAGLRVTANQVETAIADRVQDAKGMAARLDHQTAAATTAAEKLERLLERYPSTASASIRPTDSAAEARRSESRDTGILALRERISAARASGQPLAREALSRPSALPSRAPAPSLRPDDRKIAKSADDELFDLIEPALKAARSAGR